MRNVITNRANVTIIRANRTAKANMAAMALVRASAPHYPRFQAGPCSGTKLGKWCGGRKLLSAGQLSERPDGDSHGSDQSCHSHRESSRCWRLRQSGQIRVTG